MLRQPLRLLLRRPPLRDRLAGEAVVHRDDPAHRRVGAAELLHHEAVRDRVEPHAAVLLRQRAAEEADLGELRDDPAVHPLRAIPVARVRHDLAVAERAGRLPDQLLLLREREVHGAYCLAHAEHSRGRSRSSPAPDAGSAASTRSRSPRPARSVVVNDLGGALSGEGHDDTPAQQVVEEIEAAGGEAVANGENVADFERRGAARAAGDRRLRPARHPRQQRRDPPRPDAREHDRGGVGRGDRRPPQGPLRADPPRRRVLARALEGRRRGDAAA